jgi:hypothetical protein
MLKVALSIISTVRITPTKSNEYLVKARPEMVMITEEMK